MVCGVDVVPLGGINASNPCTVFPLVGVASVLRRGGFFFTGSPPIGKRSAGQPQPQYDVPGEEKPFNNGKRLWTGTLDPNTRQFTATVEVELVPEYTEVQIDGQSQNVITHWKVPPIEP